MSVYTFSGAMPENGRMRHWEGVPGVIGSYVSSRRGGTLQSFVSVSTHTIDDLTNTKRIQLVGSIGVSTAANFVMISQPTLHAGFDGQMLTMYSVPGNGFTLLDRTISSTALSLNATSLVFTSVSMCNFFYSSANSLWMQAGSLITLL